MPSPAATAAFTWILRATGTIDLAGPAALAVARIRRYAAARPGALIVPGHDSHAWQALSRVYD